MEFLHGARPRLGTALSVLVLALLIATLVLPASASRGDGLVRGYVTDAVSGAPIAGASVLLEPRTPRGSPLPWRIELASDATGYFEGAAAPAMYQALVSHGAYASRTASVAIGSGQAAWANVSLDPAGARAATLRGYARDASSGAPVAVGRIVAATPFGAPTYRNASALDASGYYDMTLVPGTYDVFTDGVTGYRPARSSWVSIASGVRWMNFTLTANPVNAWINGTVYDARTGVPLANATVSAIADGLYIPRATTDANGSYGLNVPEGSATVSADAFGYALDYRTTYAWSGSTTILDLYLAPLSGTIRGYVTNATSRAPVPGAIVAANDFDTFFDQAVANASGYYELGVVSDLLDLTASAPGYGTTRTFGYVSEGTTVWWNISLYPIIATVQGYAVDRLTGARLPNMTVAVVDLVTGYSQITTTDASGFYRARMTAVPMLLAAVAGTGPYAGGFAYGNAARGGTLWLNVTVERVTSTVHVNVTDALTGAPVPGATVSLSWLGLYADWSTTDANGTVLLDSPAALTVTVFAFASGYEFAYVIVDVAPGANYLDLAIFPDLPSDVTLRGYVTNETGAPISSARVEASGYARDTFTDYADSTGYYEVRIPAAPQTVVATASGHTGNETTVRPAPGETVWANFTLREDADRPVFLSFRATPAADVGPYNPTTLLADLSERSPDTETGLLYRMMSRSGNLGTFIRVHTLLDGSFDVAARGTDRYDVSTTWAARAPGGWLRDGLRSEWWPTSPLLLPGSHTVVGSWTNGTATAEPAYAAFSQFTGDLQFVFAPSVGIITPQDQPASVFRPTGETIRVDVVTGAQSFVPPVRGGDFLVGGVRLDYADVVPSGTYGMRLTVSDHAGSANFSYAFFDVDSAAPLADPGGPYAADIGVPLVLDGTGSTDDRGIVSYVWTFDDGGPQALTGPTATYTFTSVGTVRITLTVRDAAGNMASADVDVVVSVDGTPPVANAGSDQTVDEDVPVTLDGSGSTDAKGVVNWTWSLSDGGPRTLYGETATYTFATPGTYVVTLTARDAAGNAGSDAVTITVRDVTPPTVAFAGLSAGSTLAGVATVAASATDNVGIVRVELFVDGVSVGSDTAAPYEFALDTRALAEGAHTLRLVAHDAAGYSAESTLTVNVSNAGGVTGLATWGGLAAVVAAIVAAVAWFLFRRRRPPARDVEPSEEPSGPISAGAEPLDEPARDPLAEDLDDPELF